ncbi:MAG: hypothetical protein WBC04_10890 [Candidatus Acidiferrales bacterium]
MRQKSFVSESEIKVAQKLWGDLPQAAMDSLIALVKRFGISVSLGDVQYMDGRWYITHSGLLLIAQRRGCSGIRTSLLTKFCDSAACRWVFRATVFKSPRSKGFVGYGDADPSNTSPLVRGAEMRVAETRAVNRALRKAYGIGICSVEELGSFSAPQKPLLATPHSNGHPGTNGSSNGQPRLRDQLCLLIRQHNLDPSLVKAYAADFCGTETLKEASRDLVESFVTQLAASAKKDRDALVCKLNAYAQPVEAKS